LDQKNLPLSPIDGFVPITEICRFMDVVTLNLVLIIVNIILELAVLGTIAVLMSRNSRRMRMVQRQFVDQSNAVFLDSITAAESHSGYIDLSGESKRLSRSHNVFVGGRVRSIQEREKRARVTTSKGSWAA
jgi:hypothetical protein